jgi:hypothetical protein
MPTREQIHNLKAQLLSATQTTTGTVTSSAFDLAGFDAASIFFHFGATAPAPTSYTITECDTSGGTYTAAAAADLIDDGGTHAVSTTRRVGYVGKKRFIKGEIVLSGSTIITISGVAGYPAIAAVTNPI